MRPPKRFGECLEEMIDRRGLTVGQVSVMLGKKTELRRAIDEELTAQKREALFQKLAALGLFSDKELRALEYSLRVSEVGPDGALTHFALLRFLSGAKPEDKPQPDPSGELTRKLNALHDADLIRVTCFNSCYPDLFAALAPLFADPNRDMELKHYVRISPDGSGSASLLLSAFPVLCDARYLPYGISDAADIQAFFGDYVFIHYRKGGKRAELSFVMKSDGQPYFLTSGAQGAMLEVAEKLLAAMRPSPVLLKESHRSGGGFIDMLVQYLGLELNRTTYSICGDLGFLQIPPSIVNSAIDAKALERFAPSDINLAPQIKRLLERRYLNFYSKKKPDYHITTLEGFRRFLQTGRFRGSLPVFRAFDRDERAQIVEQMLSVAETNDLYHLHVLKGERSVTDYTLTCFDKLGVSVVPTENALSASAGLGYLYLTDSEFTRAYTRDYLSRIVPELCFDKGTSVGMLRSAFEEFKAEA